MQESRKQWRCYLIITGIFQKSFQMMQGNSGKWHWILSTDEPTEVQVGESLIRSTNCEKLLGIKIDSKFSFDKHIITVCKKS